jgi:hypothetical protein
MVGPIKPLAIATPFLIVNCRFTFGKSYSATKPQQMDVIVYQYVSVLGTSPLGVSGQSPFVFEATTFYRSKRADRAPVGSPYEGNEEVYIDLASVKTFLGIDHFGNIAYRHRRARDRVFSK